jgi:hypothetical protein
MITTVRPRIITELEFRIGNERRGSRRDYNRDGGVERIWLAVASTALNERRGDGDWIETVDLSSLCCLICVGRLSSYS